VASIIAADESLLEEAAGRLINSFGPISLQSEIFPFTETDYYAKEMGTGLVRRLLGFERLFPQGSLAQAKHETNGIERHMSSGGRRLVNIDPGLLTAERLVLATGKNRAHRVYLGQGIFGDLTLLFSGGGFHALPWTYPDYAGESIRDLLGLWREVYIQRVRGGWKVSREKTHQPDATI
jgi:hypothetical protein